VISAINKNETFKSAAREFAEKLRVLDCSREVAIVGSVAGGDPYPNDIDVALVVEDLNELSIIAKYAMKNRKQNDGIE